MKRVILFFVKWPEPGRVKTRIAATLGAERAAEIYRRLVAEVCARLPDGVPVIVCFDPAERGGDVRAWLGAALPQAVEWMPQTSGDLGARLSAAFAAAFSAGWERVAVVGSDCVEIGRAHFEETWQALESGPDVVIGPASDGGYYLLALRAVEPVIFERVRWSSEQTMADTLARAVEHGLVPHRLPVLNDVDTAEDWERSGLAGTTSAWREF